MGPALPLGLTAAEVAERIAVGEINRVEDTTSRSVGEIIRANVVTLFNILGAMLVVVLIVAPFQDAMFGLVLVGNAAIGIIQEFRAKRTLDRLALLSAPRATVIRNGQESEVAVNRVVLDDLLTLRAGEQIVVDGIVVESESLEVDESLLTGESDAILKERGDEVLSGSFVSSGSGVYKARRVGPEPMRPVSPRRPASSPWCAPLCDPASTRSSGAITWVLVPTALLLIWSQFTTLTGWPDSQAWGWTDVKEAIRLSIAGLVAMIPQGLVLLTSVAFAVGVIRLGRRQVLVQELAAVEGLARVDTVCFDKTGTLTEGRLVVDEIDLLSDRYDVRAALGALGGADPNPNATLAGHCRAVPRAVRMVAHGDGAVLLGPQVERRIVREPRHLDPRSTRDDPAQRPRVAGPGGPAGRSGRAGLLLVARPNSTTTACRSSWSRSHCWPSATGSARTQWRPSTTSPARGLP